MHPSEQAAVVLILVASAITLVLTAMAAAAWRRTRNGKLLWVMAAFALFCLKGVATAAALAYHAVGHEHLELIGSGFDLVIVALLIGPFVFRA